MNFVQNSVQEFGGFTEEPKKSRRFPGGYHSRIGDVLVVLCTSL